MKDFDSFASYMSVRLFDSAHCTIATPLLYVASYPHMVLWLLNLCVVLGDTDSDNAVPCTTQIAWKL